MIQSFKNKKTEKLYCGEFVPEYSGFEQQAVRRRQILDSATSLEDLEQLPSHRFAALKGDRKGQYSIRMNRQGRICFTWYDDRPQEVEITDYH
ncbi:MAG: type II toxin-antitoxin system RelE/ParE family toxin [Desulfohalobiaceae bacterium]